MWKGVWKIHGAAILLRNRISRITMIGNGFRIIVHVHGKPKTLSSGCGKLKNKE